MKSTLFTVPRRFLFIFLVLSITFFPLAAFEVLVNGRIVTDLSQAELIENMYPVMVNGQIRQGISFLELMPLMGDIFRAEFYGGGGTQQLFSAFDTTNIHLSYLFLGGHGWSVSLGGIEISGIDQVRLFGEELDSDELTIWVGWEGTDQLKSEIDSFAELHGITINVLEVPSILSKLTSLARGNGDLPDVVMVQSDYIPELARTRLIQRLDYFSLPYLSGKGYSAFNYDDSYWAIPLYCDSQLIFYNRELFVPDSLDWSLPEFETSLESIKNGGSIPSTWNAYSSYWLIPFQLGFGKDDLIDDDGSITINDDATRKALLYLLSLQERGLLDVRERDGMVSKFISGEVGMILSGSYSIPRFQELDIPFGVIPFPYNPETGDYCQPVLDYKGFAITRKTTSPVLARRLIEYLTATGVQSRFSAAVFKVPSNTHAWSMQREINPFYEELDFSTHIGYVLPANEAYPVFKNTMWKLITFVLNGELTVDEVVEQGQIIIDEKMEMMK